MHSDHLHFPEKPMLPLADQVGYYMQNAPCAPFFNGSNVPPNINPLITPFHTYDIQPSNACPRNLIIFDQTKNKSSIMFHPETNSTMFNHPSFGVHAPMFQDIAEERYANDENEVASPFKEDSADIDALLSMETENEECDEDDDDDDDDDAVSTARTNAMYACNSPDSCSNYESLPKKSRSVFRKSSGSRGGNDNKRQSMRKMVKALKRIVPGANRMSTLAVLDEAVRYLKSLRGKVRKPAFRNSKG